MREGSETREYAVGLDDDSVKMGKALLPTGDIGRDWCPRRNLLRRIVWRCQAANRSRVNLDDAWQVGWLIMPFVHRMRVATQRPKLSDGGYGARRLQPRRPAAVRCSAWLGGVVMTETPQMVGKLVTKATIRRPPPA